MGCSSCGASGTPAGCGDKGHCSSGGCNKMNTYDWISDLDIHDPTGYELVEVSFKNGSRKDFYINETRCVTGDMVVVEASSGYDVGQISLSGELVRLQLKKKNVKENRVKLNVIRSANERDIQKLQEARDLEKETLVRSRVISRTLGLDMKIGDIEYQADKRKATFYYTADGRVDFRELVRQYAREFKIKVEMRQIGSRQESSRIGGIGSCGRELCCSTWLSDFKSVTTTAARYQNISINQTKLSGQCGRLKCCLNYELDTYVDALSTFPDRADYIMTGKGKAALIKTNIFKGLMFYSYVDPMHRGPIVALDKEDVKKILKMNAQGKHPEDLAEFSFKDPEVAKQEPEIEFATVTGEIELPSENRRSRNKKKRGNSKGRQNRNRPNNPSESRSQHKEDRGSSNKSKGPESRPTDQNQQKPRSNNKGRGRGRNNRKGSRNSNTDPNQKSD